MNKTRGADIKKINIGIVGTSKFAEESHITGFSRLKEAQIIGICGGHNEERVTELSEKYSIPNAFMDFNNLVSLHDLDAIAIVTPNYLHYPMVIKGIEDELHILCEKPLGINLKEARTMYQRAKRYNKIHMVAFTFRFTSPVKKAKQLIESGYIGRIFHINAHFLEDHGIKSPLTWRYEKEKAGYGSIGDLGPHIIDTVRYLASEIISVCALQETFIKNREKLGGKEMGKVNVDDSTIFLAKFKKGIHGVLQTSTISVGRGSMTRIEISGENGSLILKRDLGWISLWEQKEKNGTSSLIERCKEDRSVIFNNMAKCFIESIRGENRDYPTFYDGLEVQKVLEAVVLSNKKEEWVSVADTLNIEE